MNIIEGAEHAVGLRIRGMIPPHGPVYAEVAGDSVGSAPAARTKHRRQGGVTNRNYLPFAGIWKPKITVLGNLVPSEHPLPGLQVANFLLRFHLVVRVRVSSLVSFL